MSLSLPLSAPELCPICTKIIETRAISWEDIKARGRGVQISLLRKSVEEGCSICGLLWRIATLFRQPDDFISNYIYMRYPQRLEFIKSSSHASYLASLAVNSEKSSSPWDWLKSVQKSPFSRTPMRDAENVKRWQAACDQHDGCVSHNNIDSPLPTRVIDVGDEAHDPFLYISKQDEHARYIALSHRWGTFESPASKTLRTTKETIASFRSQIPLDSFPKTFLEAIQFTRLLNVRYLWIDSLCIIQDDDNGVDWQVQSAVMNQIYSKAWLTISADQSKHEDYGLFSIPEEISAACQAAIQEIEYVDKNSKDHIAILVSDNPKHKSYHGLKHEFCLAKRRGPGGHLWDRGWVFQEDVLSPRTVYFTSTELFWQCRTIYVCDCQIRQLKSSKIDKDNMKKTMISFSRHPNSMWKKLVTQYTALKLTYESDRLPALSGIASATGRYANDYLAGIWRQDAAEQLLWRNDWDNDGRRDRRHANYAPTWSWASVIGPIKFCYLRSRFSQLWTVLDASCIPSGQNPFGTVASGWIRVKGPIVNVCVQQLQHRRDQKYEDGEYHIKVSCENTTDKKWKQHVPISHCYLDTKAKWADICNSETQHRVLLYTAQGPYQFRAIYSPGAIIGLLLINSRRKAGYWERLGLIYDYPSRKEWGIWQGIAQEGEVTII